jgi:hypothetical protein
MRSSSSSVGSLAATSPSPLPALEDPLPDDEPGDDAPPPLDEGTAWTTGFDTDGAADPLLGREGAAGAEVALGAGAGGGAGAGAGWSNPGGRIDSGASCANAKAEVSASAEPNRRWDSFTQVVSGTGIGWEISRKGSRPPSIQA